MQADSDGDFSDKMFDYCIAELQYKTKIFETTNAVSVYNGDVVKSDTAVPLSLKEALKAAVAPLEQVHEREKDWHPGSDKKVLDLVHPSLFPLVYGRSRILESSVVGLDDCVKRCGEGKTIPAPPETETRLRPDSPWHFFDRPQFTNPFSKHFQWLPCDVDISGGEGGIKSVLFLSVHSYV